MKNPQSMNYVDVDLYVTFSMVCVDTIQDKQQDYK